ncbi:MULTISPECIES: hypothetical protein [Arthrobacter]|uniref:hypothetical protein n=1 Tax=Arthrobacter TaxID=1663 RepID=UPI0006D9ECBD|nr:hypothetical protein [Arthrobacter sp. Edens01]KPN17807.1 hypothetical protein AO716_07610 [Arthrobacter sp. Edens01]
MTTRQSLLVFVRRWYLVLSGIVLTALLSWAASLLVPPSYDAQGSMVLMPPSANVGEDGNPYLQLGGMSEALDVLVRQSNAPAVRDQVLDEYPSATYTIEPDRSTSGSIVVVQATAENDAESLELLDRAMETLPAVLTRMQDDLEVTPEQRIDIMPLVVDAEGTLNVKQTLQIVAVAVAIGLAGTLMFTALADGLLLSRQRRLKPAAEENLHQKASVPGPASDVHVRGAGRRAGERKDSQGKRTARTGGERPAAGEKPQESVTGEDLRTR